MQNPHIIERAFQLAPTYSSVDEIRKVLRQEGYSNVDAHLAGASIRADLTKRFARKSGAGRGFSTSVGRVRPSRYEAAGGANPHPAGE
jgi:hypothetical protein